MATSNILQNIVFGVQQKKESTVRKNMWVNNDNI